MKQVRFTDVGRNNASWTAKIGRVEDIDYTWLRKQVKPYLLSNAIEFGLDEETLIGQIFAGIRPVGKFEITDLTQKD